MKKLSFYFLFALIASIAFTTSCQKDAVMEDELNLKSAKIETIIVDDWINCNCLTAEIEYRYSYPVFEDDGWVKLEKDDKPGPGLYNIKVVFRVDGCDLPLDYKIQGGLTADYELFRFNGNSTAQVLYNLEIRKETKKNVILMGGPIEEGTYRVFFTKNFKECGPIKIIGEWTVQWEEEVIFEEWDDLLEELDYVHNDDEPNYPLTVMVEHIVGKADPLTFTAFDCE